MRHLLMRGALLVGMLLAAGCGGGSASHHTASFKTSYSTDVNRLRQTAHAIAAAIEQAPKQSDSQVASTFQRLAARWQAQAGRLKTLKPPPSLAGDFHTLTGATTRAGADLNSIVAAARTHEVSAAKQAAFMLIRDLLSAKSASTTITNALGIK